MRSYIDWTNESISMATTRKSSIEVMVMYEQGLIYIVINIWD